MSFTFSPVFIFLLAENSFRERVTALLGKMRRRQKRKIWTLEMKVERCACWFRPDTVLCDRAARLGWWKSSHPSGCNSYLCQSTIIRLKQLTLTPQRCVYVSEWATGHHPHPARRPSFSFLPSHWSQSWERKGTVCITQSPAWQGRNKTDQQRRGDRWKTQL